MKTATLLIAPLVTLSLLPVPAPAEPPPWAPAHGWRKKNDPNYVGYTGKKWERDYGVIGGRCNTRAVGAVVGGVIGGAIGSRVEDRQDRPIAIILGTAIGAVIGARIGQDIDNTDRACIGHALELAGEKKTVVWKNEATGVSYRLTPTRNMGDERNPCREFRTVASAGQKKNTMKGIACRRGNGDWEFKS